jgi:acyl transferase domain-containing protein
MQPTTRNNETDMHYGCPEETDHAVAIIGMASRFPQGADTNEKLWNYLLQARNAMTPFPDDRVNHWGHYHPDPEHAGTVGTMHSY